MATKYLSPEAADALRRSSRLIQSFAFPSAPAPVTLHRAPKGRFAVLYGLELHECYDRAETARTLGYCLIHALECAGKLDR